MKRKIGGSEPSMAFRFENVPKEEYGLIPYKKAQLKKAVVEEGGLDRDTAYFTISDGSKKKRRLLDNTHQFISSYRGEKIYKVSVLMHL